MPKFNLCFAANVRCYGDVEIEAATLEEARAKAAAMLEDDTLTGFVFDPEWDTLEDKELIDIETVETAEA